MVGCGEMIGIGRWRPVTERGMRPRRVVVSDPSSDDLASLIEIEEQALVEKFVAHAAVEGFDVAILHRLAGRDVVPFHLMLFAPAQDSIRGELGTVIGHDHPRLATPLDDCDELAATMRNSGRRRPRLMRSSRTARQASVLSPPMLGVRAAITTSSEIE